MDCLNLSNLKAFLVNGPIKWTYHESAANLGWKHHPCNCQSYLVNNLGTIARSGKVEDVDEEKEKEDRQISY
ncbi:hypothetical protein LOK49_LG13G01795 [Camellia lanceoleosa]|uniref:Uncharacterized protein n=1 Tax=Camellia lanceoleosa TaxID=1840588 RepID=A0ACC0FJQ6_9ERIC|nr:hypothetical protein LOK49_LG13G01795 [Camellia lanceoleosa]